MQQAATSGYSRYKITKKNPVTQLHFIYSFQVKTITINISKFEKINRDNRELNTKVVEILVI